MFPPERAARMREVFALHTGAGRDGMSAQDLSRVLAPESVQRLSPLSADHLIPYGGFVQWVADYLYAR
jgi:hypothetical protein